MHLEYPGNVVINVVINPLWLMLL